MSLFNAKGPAVIGGDKSPFQQAMQELQALRLENRQLKGALKGTMEERDLLIRARDEHNEQYPRCGAPEPTGPTCPSCGGFRVSGPIPCQRCGYSDTWSE
jgi:hypothetical protein